MPRTSVAEHTARVRSLLNAVSQRPVEQVAGRYLISLAGGEQLAEPLGKPGAILYPGEYPELAALLGYGLADGHAPPLTGKKA